jgi:hypothetical protein
VGGGGGRKTEIERVREAGRREKGEERGGRGRADGRQPTHKWVMRLVSWPISDGIVPTSLLFINCLRR